MKTKTYLIVSIALLTGVSAWAQEPAAVSIYEDCSKNGKTEDIRSSGEENGHTWVNLGLPSGLRWASCNVGATTPEGYGNYYAWGETTTKGARDYSWETYKYANDAYNKLTKYCTDASKSDNGFIDDRMVLEPADDAAHVNWGGSWRMPTATEVDELIDNCTWTWTTQNGANGYKVSSKVNSNSIFLPAAGFRSGTALLSARSVGSYWSSSLNEYTPSNAWGLYFDSGSVCRYFNYRDYGRSVRPVCP